MGNIQTVTGGYETIYKITRFIIFVRGAWGFEVKFWTFAGRGVPKSNKYDQGGGGSKFCLFDSYPLKINEKKTN